MLNTQILRMTDNGCLWKKKIRYCGTDIYPIYSTQPTSFLSCPRKMGPASNTNIGGVHTDTALVEYDVNKWGSHERNTLPCPSDRMQPNSQYRPTLQHDGQNERGLGYATIRGQLANAY